MSKVLGLALGILAAIGGFVDIGDLVFNVAAGATFGYQLLWVVVVGVIGIIVYSEMCGRVAAVSGKAVFDAVRERVGFKAALVALIASELVNLMTLAAELGGVAIALQLLSGLPYRWLIVLAVVGLAIVIWVTEFEWIERIFGYGGLCMLVFVAAAVKLGPAWGKVGAGFVPHVSQNNPVLYAYFVVGILGAAMTPYEVYFYSSGGIEDQWSPKDLGLNRANAIIGYSLGGTLSLALMIVGGALFLGAGISPEHLGTIALGRGAAVGSARVSCSHSSGSCSQSAAASIDTVFSGAYNLAQFCGWEWGRYRHPRGAPRFALTWLVLLLLALGILMTGVDPVLLTEYAVIFSVVALPLTYVPILLVANDRAYMGRYVQRPDRQRLRVVVSGCDHGRRPGGDPVAAADECRPELSGKQIDIGLHVLDHQLLDEAGRRCGNVDDLAIEGGVGEVPEVTAILCGPGYWGQRAGWAGRFAGWIGGGRRVRVPWSEVAKVDSAIELKHGATELGLGRGDDRLRPYVDKIPGAGR